MMSWSDLALFIHFTQVTNALQRGTAEREKLCVARGLMLMIRRSDVEGLIGTRSSERKE